MKVKIVTYVACLAMVGPALADENKSHLQLHPITLQSEKPIVAPAVLKPINLSNPTPTDTSVSTSSNTPDTSPVRSGPKLSCHLPVSNIGPINLDAAVAVIQNGRVDIRQLDSGSDAAPLLSGVVVRLDPSATRTDTMRSLSGLVYFNGGILLQELRDNMGLKRGSNSARLDDLVFRSDGSVRGQVVDINGQWLDLSSRGSVSRIGLDSVNYLRSPQAFVFTISGRAMPNSARTAVQQIAFTKTTSSVNLGDELVIGTRPTDGMEDTDTSWAPAGRGAGLNLTGDGVRSGRPFQSWP